MIFDNLPPGEYRVTKHQDGSMTIEFTVKEPFVIHEWDTSAAINYPKGSGGGAGRATVSRPMAEPFHVYVGGEPERPDEVG